MVGVVQRKLAALEEDYARLRVENGRIRRMASGGGDDGADSDVQRRLGQIASAVQMLVHVSRLAGGERRVMAITEIEGLDRGEIRMRPVFRYDAEQGRHLDLRDPAAAGGPS